MLELSRWREWRDWVPSDCPGCGRRVRGQDLCGQCREMLEQGPMPPRCPVCAHRLRAGACPDCARRTPDFDRAITAFDYAGLGRQLVRDYKLRRRVALAGLLAAHLARAVRAAGPAAALASTDGACWRVVPVPAHRDALRERGFSPPAEVARLLARQLGLRHDLDALHRVRESPKQAVLGRAARQAGPQGAFACARDLGGLSVAVVDDVLTTGATLHAAAVALKAAGAGRVEAWVVARTPGHDPAL